MGVDGRYDSIVPCVCGRCEVRPVLAPVAIQAPCTRYDQGAENDTELLANWETREHAMMTTISTMIVRRAAAGRAAVSTLIYHWTRPLTRPLGGAALADATKSKRRECLDHVLILSERHLRRVLSACSMYCNTTRPTKGSNKRCQLRSSDQTRRHPPGRSCVRLRCWAVCLTMIGWLPEAAEERCGTADGDGSQDTPSNLHGGVGDLLHRAQRNQRSMLCLRDST
jgi:hypothetical protein